MFCRIVQMESKMYFWLEESDICLLQTLNGHIDTLYEDNIVSELSKDTGRRNER